MMCRSSLFGMLRVDSDGGVLERAPTGPWASRVAGAGVPGHLHWHIVPRWAGDVNFMPSVAGARVLPQALDELWLQLTTAVKTAPP